MMEELRNYIFICVLAIVDLVPAKAPNGLSSRFLTVFAVFSCEYFLAGANVAVCFVKSNTLAFVPTRQLATRRLQKEKNNIFIASPVCLYLRGYFIHKDKYLNR